MTKTDSNECPTCTFKGADSDSKKFTEEQKNQFPLGYAFENHPKIEIIQNGGKSVQIFAKNEKHEIIFEKTKRCPICGHIEGVDTK